MAEVRKAVITAAGIGTRLLPATRQLPKEMFPLCVPDEEGELTAKPAIELVFESLYDHNIRDFCIVVGRGKRAIEDHFAIDGPLLDLLLNTGKSKIAKQMEEFYRKINSSDLAFINQPEPVGFGDAILRCRNHVGNEDFVLHAGDDIIISDTNDHMKRLEHAFWKYDAAATCLLVNVDDPRPYGVVWGSNLTDKEILISHVEEKPAVSDSNLAIVAVYVFKPVLFGYLLEAISKVSSEKTLEYAIKSIVSERLKFVGVMLDANERRVDIGNPQSYLSAMEFLAKRASAKIPS